MPAAINSSHPKNSMETDRGRHGAHDRKSPEQHQHMPKSRNQPQLLMISAGIRTSKAWISLMALSPVAAGAPSPGPRRVAVRSVRSGDVALGLACESHAAVACGQGATRLFCFGPWLDGSTEGKSSRVAGRCSHCSAFSAAHRAAGDNALRAPEGLFIKSAVSFIAPMIAR
jgi:hypothetical protein